MIFFFPDTGLDDDADDDETAKGAFKGAPVLEAISAASFAASSLASLDAPFLCEILRGSMAMMDAV